MLTSRNLFLYAAVGILSIFVAVVAPVEANGRQSQQVARAALHSPDLRANAAAVEIDGALVIEGVEDEAGDPAGDLILERFRVFAPGARIVVNTPHGVERLEPAKNTYFRGYVDGDPTSRAVVTVRENGGVRGIVLSPNRTFIFSDETGHRRSGAMAMRSLSADELDANSKPFSCATDRIWDGQTLRQLLPSASPSPSAAQSGADPVLSNMSSTYALTLAIETDYEFYQLFGNTADAADYVADLVSYVSTFYESEINTTLELGDVSLWSFADDPWEETSTTCGLFEFGRRWNNAKSDVERGLAHFLSGKNNGGGVAWLDVLCGNSFNYNHQGSCPGLTPQTSNYGGAYGYSGTIDGDFDINNPSVLWDVVVVAHEIGHNFGSPHSHCYGGIGGSADPVDSCYTGECGYSGCACDGGGLPLDCPGQGNNCGTIMSYCHLLQGGMSNVAMTFGVGHAFGVAPERVANHMFSRVQATASAYPACLAPSNTAPVANADSYGLSEGGQLSVSAPGVLSNDTDAEDDGLTASRISGPSHGALTLRSNGSFVYTPDNGFSGTDSFDYIAHDGREASAVATVTLNVQACVGANDVVIESAAISGVVAYVACSTITAGPSLQVRSDGDLTLEATAVVFVNDFSVEAGGELAVVTR